MKNRPYHLLYSKSGKPLKAGDNIRRRRGGLCHRSAEPFGGEPLDPELAAEGLRAEALVADSPQALAVTEIVKIGR